MMEHVIRRIVGEMLAQQGVPRHAAVKSVDPVNALVKVSYDEADDAVSGWLPIAQMGGGANWTAICLPLPGTQVFVHPDMGDIEHGVVGGVVHSTAMPPGKIIPYMATEGVPLVPGEFTVISASGASMRFTDGGVIETRGTWKHMGDILASGQITDLNGVHGSLDVLREDYNQHLHTGVQPGPGDTGMTTKPTP